MHSGIDARAYDAWVTREPPWDDHEPWQELARCSFCHSWVSTRKENVTASVQHTRTAICYGTLEGFDAEGECPLCYWDADTKKWIQPPHGKHEFPGYAGTSTYYRCQRCGGEAELQEF